MSLYDEESTDAKKELDDIDNKFDEARVAKSLTGRGEFTFHIWILGLSEVRAFFNFTLPSSTQVHHYKCIFVQSISI